MRVFLASLSIVFVLSPAVAWSRIGETDAEIGQRFGQPIAENPSPIPGVTLRTFRKSGMLIVVASLHGRSVQEVYGKESPGKLSEIEVAILLRANTPAGKEWKELPPKEAAKEWSLDDDSVVAKWTPDLGQLAIATKQALLYGEKMKANQDAYKLKGF